MDKVYSILFQGSVSIGVHRVSIGVHRCPSGMYRLARHSGMYRFPRYSEKVWSGTTTATLSHRCAIVRHDAKVDQVNPSCLLFAPSCLLFAPPCLIFSPSCLLFPPPAMMSDNAHRNPDLKQNSLLIPHHKVHSAFSTPQSAQCDVLY